LKTVAIYGFSSKTRDYVHQSSVNELWTLNNAYKYDVPMERVTRWYELHKDHQIFFDDKEKQKYYQFLTQQHPFPIYMQEQRDEFPCSVKYPLDDIAKSVDGGRYYLTNSIALMLAHAIYEGYERIELYGVDLAYGTEYSYQKAGTEYMMGVAIGMGIDVYVPPECPLLNSPVYGYNAHTQTVHVDILKEHRHYYQQVLDSMVKKYIHVVERYHAGDKDALAEIAAMNPDLWMWDGAQTAVNVLIDKAISGVVGRQVLERERDKLDNSLLVSLGRANYANGVMSVSNSGEAAQEYEKQLERMHGADGMKQAVTKLIALIDFRPIDLELEHTINISEREADA